MNIEDMVKFFNSLLSYFVQYDIILITAIFLLVMVIFQVTATFFVKKSILDKAFTKIIRLVIVLIFLYFLKTQKTIPSSIFKILQTLEVLLFGYIIYLVAVGYYIKTHLIKNKKINVNHIIIDLIKLVIFVIVALIFLRTVLSVNLVTILTPSAIFTVIIGFAMQDTIGNLIAGLVLQIEKPYEVGDWIELDGLIGEVTEINWRYTKVKTFNMQYIIIPNKDLASQKVVNFTKPTKEYTMVMPIGVSYEHSPLKVKRAIEEVVVGNNSAEFVGIHLREYGDSSINYDIIFKIQNFALFRRIRNELNTAIWYKFKERGIEIPFPIRTVIMKNEKNTSEDSELRDILQKFEIFENLNADTLTMLKNFGIRRKYNTGEVVFREGDYADSMFFVLDGELSVIKNHKEISSIGPGEFFGEIGLLAGSSRNATVSAKIPSTAFEVDRGAFKAILEKETDIVDKVAAIINSRKSKENAAEVDKVSSESRESLFKKFRDIFGITKT